MIRYEDLSRGDKILIDDLNKLRILLDLLEQDLYIFISGKKPSETAAYNKLKSIYELPFHEKTLLYLKEDGRLSFTFDPDLSNKYPALSDIDLLEGCSDFQIADESELVDLIGIGGITP